VSVRVMRVDRGCCQNFAAVLANHSLGFRDSEASPSGGEPSHPQTNGTGSKVK
jgi:hypothetical protein